MQQQEDQLALAQLDIGHPLAADRGEALRVGFDAMGHDEAFWLGASFETPAPRAPQDEDFS